MTYSCECCAYKCLYPKDLEKHNLTNKHQKNMTKKEIKCEGCLQKDVIIERLQQEINELRSKYDSLVDKIVLQNFQPVIQPVIQPVVQPVIQPVIQHVIQPEDYPERWNEKYLNDNFKTSINELLNQVIFDEDEVADLLENPHNLNKLVLKTLKETVENTDISHRGLVTADTSRKKMWIKKNKDNWEVDPKATFYIKNKLQNEIIDILEKMVKNERGDFVAGAETYTDLLVTTSQSTNKWENIDTKLMEMFQDKS